MGNKNLLKFTHPNFIATQTCDPYFQPHVHQELVRLFEANPNRRMQVNSAYRSCVRQAVLREFYSRGICSISMAARVGHSNHEHGTAIDVENWQEWKPILTRAGWRWQGSKDPMHFELPSRQQIAIASIRAFQEVYNELFSAQKILTDGVWGPNTLAALLRTPADGGISAKIPYFDRYLRLGDNGADVVRYAQQLRTAGFYPQKIEHNRFETPLRDATISYQKSRGLVGDGVVGPATIIELFASVNPNPFAIFID
jgi:murein L,D-transpeptidase YcbB/YkuD